MRTNRFLASLLALLMVFSLLPAFGVTASAEDPKPIEDPVPAEAEIEELLPEEAEAEALVEDEPVADAEPQATEYYNLWINNMRVTSVNAGNLFGGAAVYDDATKTLEFKKAIGLSGVHEGALIDAPGMEELTIIVPASGLKLTTTSTSATRYIRVADGKLTIIGNLTVTINNADAVGIEANSVEVDGNLTVNATNDDSVGIVTANGLNVIGNLTVNAGPCDAISTYADGVRCASGDVVVEGNVDICADRMAIVCSDGGIFVSGNAFAYNNTTDMNTASFCAYGGHGMSVGGIFGVSIQSNLVVDATGPLTFGGPVEITNNNNFGDGIRTTSGGIVFEDDVTIDVVQICVSAGDSTEGIIFRGNVNITNHKAGLYSAPAIDAHNGPVTVEGDLTLNGYGEELILAKGDISIGGSATLKNGLNYKLQSTGVTYYGKAAVSTEGSFTVTGDCSCTAPGDAVYAFGDITVGGNASFRSGTTAHDFAVKAENGTVEIGGSLAVFGMAETMVWAKGDVSVEGDLTVGEQDSRGIVTGVNGLYSAEGSILHRSGVWDIRATGEALRAAEGIVIADGYGIVYPVGGVVTRLDGGYTVTEADGTTPPARVIIDDQPPVIITFDPAGGTLNFEPVILHAGDKVKYVPIPTREGWTFLGWFTALPEDAYSAGNGTGINGNMTFSEDTTFYAHWYLPGDINGDGTVNNKDVTRLITYIKKGNINVVERALDVNGDNSPATNKDVTRLITYLKQDNVVIH